MALKTLQQRMQEAFRTEFKKCHAAVCAGDLALLRTYLATAPEPHDGDSDWGTPLHVAVWCNNLDAARMLVDAGADPLLERYEPTLPYSSLALAAQLGLGEMARFLWSSVLADHRPTSDIYQNPLVIAASHGHSWLVDEMLRWPDGWSAEVKDKALFNAAANWNTHVVTVLLDSVAYMPDILTQTIFRAVQSKPMDVGTVKIPCEVDDAINQERLVLRLLKAGVGPDIVWETTKMKKPLIHYAADGINLVGGLRALLGKGADPNVQDSPDRRTPLHYLTRPIPIQYGQHGWRVHETGIYLLIEHGASTLIPDLNGETPLHFAAFSCHIGLFKHHLSHSPPDALSLTNNHSESLLHYAAAGGNIEVLQFLLSSGHFPNINQKNSNGWTPLLCALAQTHTVYIFKNYVGKTLADAMRAAQILLDRGADATVVTDEGWTALHCLACHRALRADTQVVELAMTLMARGAPVRTEKVLPEWKGIVGCFDGLPWGFRLSRETTGEEAVRGVTTVLEWAVHLGSLAVERALREVTGGVGGEPVSETHSDVPLLPWLKRGSVDFMFQPSISMVLARALDE